MNSIKFTLETTDEQLARIYMDAVKFYSVLTSLDNELRSVWKHSDEATESEQADRWRTRLFALMEDEGARLWD